MERHLTLSVSTEYLNCHIIFPYYPYYLAEKFETKFVSLKK